MIGDNIEISVDTHEFGTSDDDTADDRGESSDSDKEGQVSAPRSRPSGRNAECAPSGETSQSGDTLDESEYDKLLENPQFERVFDTLFEKRMKKVQKETKERTQKLVQQQQQHRSPKGKSNVRGGVHGRTTEVIKSPSDSTIYSPALRKGVQEEVAVQRISEFVESVRLDVEKKRGSSMAKDVISPILNVNNTINATDMAVDDGVNDSSEDEDADEVDHCQRSRVLDAEGRRLSRIELARERAQREKAHADKFKSKIEKPKGKDSRELSPSTVRQTESEGVGLTDDDFFHLTCHVEESLIGKIEEGKFVELEKLLPRDKNRRFGTDDTRLEWVHRDGSTFLVPAQDKDSKINGVRHWEQAFRVYATIYCGANPSRAREIWQYIAVINTAASSYIWENVAQYDYTFRHLMEFNPARSWSNVYNQMWNLCMCDPLLKNAHGHSKNNSTAHNRGSFSSTGAGTSGLGWQSSQNTSDLSANANNSAIVPKKKNRYCMNFNRGEVCKYGKKCQFAERCCYCDSASHPAINCPCLDKKV